MVDQVGYNIALGIISGILTVPLIAFFFWLQQYFRNRKVRRFWKPFLEKHISIVMAEYPAAGNDLSAKIARKAAGGYLVSKGNALAMSRLYDFLSHYITKGSSVTVCGDKSGVQGDGCLIIIGSPANNLFSQTVFRSLEDRFHVPYTILYDQQTGEIWFESKDGKKTFHPRVEEGRGVDYALVARAKYRSFPDCHVILLAGAHMFGAKAAADAITNRSIINHVEKVTRNAENVLFLLKTNVINNHSGEPELEFESETHICILHENESK